MDEKRILDIKDLNIWYKTYKGYAEVVDGINFYINRGEKVGLVGESGCGKTTMMKSILRVLDKSVAHIPSGNINFLDKDILNITENEMQEIRRKNIAMISQSPMAALNPVFKIKEQMFDIIKYSGHYKSSDKKEIFEIAKKSIENVMISDAERILDSYPYQLSGGMRQRICIAMSLITPRDLLIADEPGTALDVTIQAQVHKLLNDIVKKDKCSLIMVTHSLGVARELVDRIYVMYAGNIVETCNTKDLFKEPLHPYTRGLLDCVPRLSGGGLSTGIYGYIPDYHNPTKGCRFYPRCSKAMDICKNTKPPVIEKAKEHYVSCHLYQ